MKQIGYIGKNAQGNRVYSTDGVGATVASQTGGLGGRGVSLIIEKVGETMKDLYKNVKESPKESEKIEFKYVSLFSGVGGFERALDSLGGECVFASEIDRFASQAYEVLYGDDVLRGDIAEIDEKNIPEHDLLVGGFPYK